jgi:hypothetical protein
MGFGKWDKINELDDDWGKMIFVHLAWVCIVRYLATIPVYGDPGPSPRIDHRGVRLYNRSILYSEATRTNERLKELR